MALEMTGKKFGRNITRELFKFGNKNFGLNPTASAHMEKFWVPGGKIGEKYKPASNIISMEDVLANKARYLKHYGPEASPIVSSSNSPLSSVGRKNYKQNALSKIFRSKTLNNRVGKNLNVAKDALKTVDVIKTGTAPNINKAERTLENIKRSGMQVFKKVRGQRIASVIGKAGMFGLGMAGVMGLSLALSKTRHGRND